MVGHASRSRRIRSFPSLRTHGKRILAVVFSCLVAWSAAARSPDRPAVRYQVGYAGFAAPSLSHAGYAVLGLTVDPEPTRPFVPALGLVYSFTMEPGEADRSLFGFDISTTLLSLARHPFGPLLPRASLLIPGAGMGIRIGLRDPGFHRYIVSIRPLRFFLGDTILGCGWIELVLDGDCRPGGWGVRLFDVSYAL